MNRINKGREQQVKQQLDSQMKTLAGIIGIYRSENAQITSEEAKNLFLEELGRESATKPGSGWKHTGHTEEGFALFWEIAWSETLRRN